MFTYSQTTGELSHNGQSLGTGYSGHGDGVNNPACQNMPMVGPIPLGKYQIGPEFTHPKAGPICMRLTALPGTVTFGRDGFMMHGDNSLGNRSASEGCIIMPRLTRIQVAALSAGGDNTLNVVADTTQVADANMEVTP